MAARGKTHDLYTAMGEVARLIETRQQLDGALDLAVRTAWQFGASATDLGELLSESRQTVTRRMPSRVRVR